MKVIKKLLQYSNMEYFKSRQAKLRTGEIIDYNYFLQNSKEEFTKSFRKKVLCDYKLDDFELLKSLGSGSFGHVVLVHLIKKDSYHAMKILRKIQIKKTKQIDHTLNEKQILEAIKFPFIVYLQCSFKDNSNIYFVMPFITGGEMFTHLRQIGKFSETLSRFYASQVILALEYLHYLDLIYRDLKPENILIDHQGNLKITDLGFCKYVPGRTWTMCGTPDYIAPEIILSKGYGKSVDWWSFGVLVYEMTAGYPPFYANDPMQMFEKIVSGKYSNPVFFSNEVKDLIRNLLQVDLTRRYGNLKNGINDIKSHKWFKNCDWLAIVNLKTVSPYIPQISGITDISHFEGARDIDKTLLKISSVDLYPDDFDEF
ncbi:hypothetical protein L9F63_013805 [Diploptera punctata]|uniref:Uncharacterized protein n=1 Tax=Diploptera punctata TaxID=6984 RepID=A0AAD8AA63_DIPPU|nr:hypothetical protein L9F63_013805 [Diploptera punctata]